MTLRVDPSSRDGVPYVPEGAPSTFADAGYCGASFNEGLIRFHDAASAGATRESVMDAFSTEVAGTLDVLAFDWMGRQIVTVTGGGDDPVLYVADIGRGQVSEWMRWSQFCSAVQDGSIAWALEEDALTVLCGSLEPSGSMLAFDECFGYSMPLFLGGAENADNIEVIDLELYWHIGAQVYQQVRGLPPGASVSFRVDGA